MSTRVFKTVPSSRQKYHSINNDPVIHLGYAALGNRRFLLCIQRM